MALQLRIWKWVQGLPTWQSDLVRRLCAKTALSDDELKEVRRNLVAEHGLIDPANPATPVRAQLSDIPSDATARGSVRILGLRDLKNIGAVEPGQGLAFGRSGLTVIYGDNATGKSSYARVLKQACRAAETSTQILSNVFVAGASTGMATIEYEENGEAKSLVRNANSNSEPVLSTVSVFDAGSARIYATSPNEVAYIPSGLSLFERLAQAQNRVRDMLQEETSRLQSSPPTFNDSEFVPDTPVRKILQSLSEKTKPDEIKKLGTLAETDDARLPELEKTVAAMKVADPKQMAEGLRRKAVEARRLKQLVDSLAGRLSDEVVMRTQESDLMAEQTIEAARLASEEAFINEPVRGVGSGPWKFLWDAACKFSEEVAYPNRAFPVTEDDARCVLCHQPLTDEAQDRMRRFKAYIQDRSATIAREAVDKRNRAREQILDPNVAATEILPTGHGLRDESPDLAAQLDTYYQKVMTRLRGVKFALDTHDWSVMPALAESPASALLDWANKREDEAKFNDDVGQPEAQVKASRELDELRARKQLQKRLPEVLTYVDKLRQIAVLRKAEGNLGTKSVTMIQNELTGQVVTDVLRERLEQELTALNSRQVRVKMDSRGSKGKTNVSIQLGDTTSGAKVQDVLSEGEQRAVSLAFFLAEIGAAAHDGGAILDDPVSSLDHLRRSHVAKRLVAESKRRQVIVFTHDLVFLHELKARAEEEKVGHIIQTVRRAAGKIGLVAADLPWLAQSLGGRVRYLGDLLTNLVRLENIGDDEYSGQAKLWVERLRETWERAVEDRLLGGVVQRFNPAVQTTRLKNVSKRFSVELVEEVTIAMTETSKWVHDQATAINTPPPTTDELKEALGTIESFLKKIPNN